MTYRLQYFESTCSIVVLRILLIVSVGTQGFKRISPPYINARLKRRLGILSRLAQCIWPLLRSRLTIYGSSLGCEFKSNCAIEGSSRWETDNMTPCRSGALRTLRNVYGIGSPTITFFRPPSHTFRPQAHLCAITYNVYNWNIIDCDIKQPIQQPTSLIVTSNNYNVHVLNYKKAIISRSTQMIY